MHTITLGHSDITASRLAYGCMRISGGNTADDQARGKAAVRAAIDAGYTHFDHADIYGGGNSETVFAQVLRESPGLREQLVLTGKCGIVTAAADAAAIKRYDFSREHILGSVDGSLTRLGVEHLDLLLLHRPDFLMQPSEVAAAFETLLAAGKVRHFGVSNFTPSQLRALQHHCDMPLVVNQVEINIDNIGALSDGTLDLCLELGVTPMAWCPLGGVVYPGWGGSLDAAGTARVESELARQSAHYEAPPWVVMLAWLLKHPAGIVPIVGSTTPARIAAACQSLDLSYSREDWYRLLQARNGYEVA